LPGYILIGRREDFVWTLTSARADITDIYVETLCEGSDTKVPVQGPLPDHGGVRRGHP
jgi:acyl-homoserine lactone acylase PvdQ